MDENSKDFLFLEYGNYDGSPDDEDKDSGYGIFITREHYNFLSRFNAAKNNSEKFGDFWESIGESGREFVRVFITEDVELDHVFPKMNESMEKLMSELWIFYDGDFPDTQCVEATYTDNLSLFPSEYVEDTIRTEYGANIGLFNISNFKKIKRQMEKSGCTVENIVPDYLYANDYS